MIEITEYIKQSKADRQAHLRLNEPCIERGGGGKKGNLTSSFCKGLLADMFDTSMPSGHKINVCHACNNSKCSNKYHLYWGTGKENIEDAIECGAMKHATIHERMVAKYGEEGAREKYRAAGNKPKRPKSINGDAAAL